MGNTDTKKILLTKAKFAPKTAIPTAIVHPLLVKFSNLKPLLSIIFPQGFQISKIVGHLTLEGGGKKTFKRYLKIEHTHTHSETDTHTDRHTYGQIDL